MKNTEIDFTYGAVFLAALLIISDYSDILVHLFCAVLIHELGHIFAILTMGSKIRAVTLNAGGFKIDYNSTEFTYFQDILSAAAGPIFGAAAAVLASNMGFTVFGGISFSISLFNLLPVRPLDGGRILWSLLMWLNERRSVIFLNIIEIITLTALWSAAIYTAILTAGNFSLCCITGVLTFYYCKER